MFLQKSTSEFDSKWRERRYEIFRLDVEMAGKLGAPSSTNARANQNPKSKDRDHDGVDRRPSIEAMINAIQ